MAEGKKPPLSGDPGSRPPPLGSRPPLAPPLGIRPPLPPPFLGNRPPVRPPPVGALPVVKLLADSTSAPMRDGPVDQDRQEEGKEKEEPKRGGGGGGEEEEEEKDGPAGDKASSSSSSLGGKMKISFGGLGKRPAIGGGITMKLKPQVDTAAKKQKTETNVLQNKPASVAQAFGSDSEDEEEEMPPEAKLRMRNVGRDTPTSSGPNSFYKTNKGFTDPRSSWRNELDD